MPRSLTVKLLLLVGLTALPMLLAQVLLAQAWREEQVEQAKAQLIAHNARAAEHLRMLQEQAKQAIELLAQHDWPIEDRAACTLEAQKNLATLPGMFANLLVVAPNGQVLCNAKAPDKLHNLADRDYVQRTLQRNATGIGGLITGRTTGTPVIGLATPHRNAHGEMDYLLATSIELSEVTRQLDARLPSSIRWWMLDEHATVIASNDPNRAVVGKPLNDEGLIQALWPLPPPTVLRHHTAAGEAWLVSQLVVGDSALGDRLVLAQPIASILAQIDTPLYLAAASSLIALLLALGGAWAIARRFRRKRIEPLLTALHRIEHGDFSVRLAAPVGRDELDTLTRAIDHMAETLQAQNQRIASQQATLVYQAQHDPLTGLPNRLMVANHFAKACAEAHRHHEHMALLILDLDHFKTINEGRGYTCGDRLLVATATRLERSLRDTDNLARIGGDEFLILLERITKPDQVIEAIQRIRQALQEPFLLDGEAFELTTSIGIALYPSDSDDFDKLLQQADAALHQCKAEERNSYRFFTPSLTEAAERQLAIEQMIRDALRLGWFTLHYQAQIQLEHGQRVGVEALLRLHHPERGMIPPGQFLPVVEERYLIVSIGAWVIKEACQQMARWRKKGQAPAYVAVNVAARQILHDDLPATVRAALQESGIPPECLELEVTEASFLKHTDEVLKKLDTLHTMGIRLALDDFGTGYSSLSYLRRLPLDRLKIDQSFVRDMLHDKHDKAIVRAIIQLGKALELEVVAEGVETQAQADELRALGCTLGQGYLFGRPQPA
ncbi:MAG: bifunctional diguanylate cyclase/phosphodiesterase [Halothiobacillaceae bacterium]